MSLDEREDFLFVRRECGAVIGQLAILVPLLTLMRAVTAGSFMRDGADVSATEEIRLIVGGFFAETVCFTQDAIAPLNVALSDLADFLVKLLHRREPSAVESKA